MPYISKAQVYKNKPTSQSQVCWDGQDGPQSESFSYVSAMPDEAGSHLPSAPSHSLDDHKGKENQSVSSSLLYQCSPKRWFLHRAIYLGQVWLKEF